MHIKSFRSKSDAAGFTLIEILIVLAIIGILAEVIMTSLSASKLKADDAFIKSTMGHMRSEVGIIVDGATTDTVCDPGGKVNEMYLSAYAKSAQTGGSQCIDGTGFILNNDGTETAATDTNSNEWAVAVQLKVDPTQWFCIDYTGFSGVVTGLTIDGGASPSDRVCS